MDLTNTDFGQERLEAENGLLRDIIGSLYRWLNEVDREQYYPITDYLYSMGLEPTLEHIRLAEAICPPIVEDEDGDE